jgi:hypothetical protein
MLLIAGGLVLIGVAFFSLLALADWLFFRGLK